MHYTELEELRKAWKGKVCLFGAGLIGKTWAYDILKEIGFQIDFYCDNNKEENLIVRDNIKTISLNSLYFYKNEVLVFITAMDKYQHSIRRQLENSGIYNIISVDYLFLQTFAESIFEMDDWKIKERFKCIFDDREYISRQFEYHMGYKLDLNNPQTFNEKLQWLKLYDRKPEYTQMVDKYEAKKYVADIIGDEYIIPTLGIYNSFDEIEFEKLPQQFVLKCTHDSGGIVLCKNKNHFDIGKAKIFLESRLKSNFYWIGREWPYKNITPQIIAEEYLVDESKVELKDYKFFAFDGKVKLIQVDYDRFVHHKRNLYTIDWKYIDAAIKYPTDPNRKIECPTKLEKMIEISEKLSKHIPYVRVDLYLVGNRIYFGELTFYHGAGYEKFEPRELEYKLGDMIKV